MGRRQRNRLRAQAAEQRTSPAVATGSSRTSDAAGGGDLDRLAALAGERRRLEQQELELMAALVTAGATWPAIAAALGVSRQAARQRFVRHCDRG